MIGKCDKTKLKHIELVDENNSYFLDVTYEYENKYGVYELNIPRIHLPICRTMIPNYKVDYDITYNNVMSVDFGFGYLDAISAPGTKFTHKITQIKKKPQKMTLAEIEAKLGHKIELVSE